MKIYTSYFSNLTNIPDNVIPITICGKVPKGYVGEDFKKLAPKYEFWHEWTINHDDSYYVKHFQAEVLDILDVDGVVKRLSEISGGKDVVLICYESPEKFCHRHLVADWLIKAGYEVAEYEYRKLVA